MKNLVEYVNENLDNKDFINEHPEICDILEFVEKWSEDEIIDKFILEEYSTALEKYILEEYSTALERWLKDTFKTKFIENKESLKSFLEKEIRNN